MGFLFAFIDFYAQRCFLFGTGEYAPFYHSLSVFFYCLITALVVNGMSPKIVRSKKRKEFLRFIFSHPDLRRKAREQYGSEFRIPESDATNGDEDSDKLPDEARSTGKGQAEGNDGTMSVYVGNIPFRTDRQEIEDLFRTVGEVYSVKCFQKHSRKESYSYAFVEMNAAEAQKAIEQLDGTELDGRKRRIPDRTARPTAAEAHAPENPGNTAEPEQEPGPPERPYLKQIPIEKPQRKSITTIENCAVIRSLITADKK